MCYFVSNQTFIFLVFCLIQIQAHAQIEIDDQPDTSYYRFVVNTISPFALTERETVSAKAQPIPSAFMDTLVKYDWVDMGGYNYLEGKFNNYFSSFKDLLGPGSQQLYIKRFCNDGFIGDFSLNKTVQNKITITTITFDKGTASKITGLKKVNSVTYMVNEDFGEKTYLQLVAYKDRKLVVDLTKYGKIGEKPVKFRIIYFAIAQKFKWQIK